MKESVARLTGKVVAPSTVFGPSIFDLEAETAKCAEAATAFELVDAFLSQFKPTPTTELARITEIVRCIATDRSIKRVEMLAERFDLGLRQLQRVFREYVGVSPKWVIRRHRLIEAAERLRSPDESIDFAVLALDLGYADQSHFIRDFKTMVGMTPAEFHKSLR